MATNSGSNKENLVKMLENGKISLHELEQHSERADQVRVSFLEKRLGKRFNAISSGIYKTEECRGRIDNMIGAVQVPLGIAGPLRIIHANATKEYYIPLATTEGALVASVSRGCKAITAAGGANSIVLQESQRRSILFKAEALTKAVSFSAWVSKNFTALKKAGEKEERFLDIISIEPHILGLNIWLQISAYTHDAMGMNMITVAGKKIADYISKKTDLAEFVSETGNMCADKKPSSLNLIIGRGKKVIASVDIPENIIQDVLKTSSDKIIEMNYRKNLLGSAASGSLGYNAHFANTISAIFIATGQDAAHAVDGSLGFTTAEKTKKGMTLSATIPSLQVGTVGGGTGLSTQKECLSIMGIEGPGNPPGTNSRRFAEIVAAAVLAGELSLLAALCTKELSKAHQKLNR